jgi:virulence factor Mce-like protein
MMTRLFAARGFLSIAVIAIVGLAVFVGFRLVNPSPEMRSYCADMPDGIGLYTGSAVTILGIPVGTVTDVAPNGATARVRFDIPADRALPTDVGATTLSTTLIADRNLALIGNEPSGASWPSKECITKTLTPKSLTKTFAAIADLADQLNGAHDPGQRNVIADGLTTLDTATAGTGDRINNIIRGLGSALNSPDAAIGHIGGVLDALTALTRSASNNWADVKTMISRLAQALNEINNIAIPPLVHVLYELRDVLPQLNELTTMLGGPLLRRLDATPNLPQMISAGVGSLREIVNMVPAITTAFMDGIDPITQRASLAYSPPTVAIPQQNAAQLCGAVNVLAPGSCTDPSDGMVNVPLTQLIFGSVVPR